MARPRARQLASCAGVAAAGVLTTARAVAQTKPSYELTYEGVRGCPRDAAFRADMIAHVHDLSRSAGARVALRVVVAEGGGFHGELGATDREGHVGHREVDGAVTR